MSTKQSVIKEESLVSHSKDNGRKRALWSEEQIDVLKQFYPIRTANEMKELLPMYSREQIYRKAKQLNLKKKKEIAYRSRVENSVISRQDIWTDKEKQTVIEVYPTQGVSGVQEILPHRSEHSIKRIAERLGVVRESTSPVWELAAIEPDENSFSATVKFKRR